MAPKTIALILTLFVARLCLAQSSAYCTITSIDTQELSNGVQITIKSDGVLNYTRDYESYSATKTKIIFTNAKSGIGKNYIDVSKFPVSYIQLSVPQTAEQGVGVALEVALFEANNINIESSNDKQSVIITVNSSRTITKRNGEKNSSGAGRIDKTMTIDVKDGKIDLMAVKANLRKLLVNLARKTGTNIAIDDSVKDREVSLSLSEVTLDEAMKSLAGSCGLASASINGVYMVTDGVPQDLATYHLSSTASFAMNSVKAQVASGLLPTFLYSFLHVNDAQNAIVVTAPDAMLKKIEKDFKKIDVAPPQIMIEALAVEVSSTNDLTAGLLTSYTEAQNQGGWNSNTGDISYSTVGTLPSDFKAKLTALVSKGKANVRATPRMAAINGHSADLFIGDTKFIKVTVTSYGGKEERIQGVDVGVKLKVLPWTGGNGEITVYLEPEVSNISELDRDSGLPVLSTRRASTTVRVKDGETVMIGGLVQKQEYETRRKIPILGDLPLFGPLFQSKSTSKIDSELVIFVTPHVLNDAGQLKDSKKEDEIRERFK